VGEYQTAGLWFGKDISIISLKSINFPQSLGLLYSTFTAFLGFKVNEDEYKVMGLAAYGEPTLINNIYKLIDVKKDGSFKLNMKYFSYQESLKMWSKKFEDLFGLPRKPTDPIKKHARDLAASIQKVTEEIYFKVLNYLYQKTRSENLCLSGGVALNALANGKIYKKTPFKKVYIFGPAGDSGAAVGSTLYTYHSIFKKEKKQTITNLYLGSSYSNNEIETILIKNNLTYLRFKSVEELIEKTANLLSKNNIVGWFQGKIEFGPRALGNRSILAKPNPRIMKDQVNKIKLREQFRPFAGSILQERVQDYFNVPVKNHWSPFMVFCFQVKEQKRDELAAIVHYDNTCRVQTVSEENGRYYLLIKKFYQLTGLPCILNTSFNLKGEPIVETPQQALDDFLKTKMDYLVIEDFLVSK
jgi:carbamoyltransferase